MTREFMRLKGQLNASKREIAKLDTIIHMQTFTIDDLRAQLSERDYQEWLEKEWLPDCEESRKEWDSFQVVLAA